MRKICLVLLCLALAVVSCTHKDFCLHHPHVVKLKVEFNWQNTPEANPKGMSVWFYPIDGGDPVRYDFRGTEGGYVELVVGEYNIITYNNDTEAVLFANQHNFATHQAYTREGNLLEPVLGSSAAVPRANGTEEEKVVITPDMLWGCTSLEVEVAENGVKYICRPFEEDATMSEVESEEHIITLYPCDLMCLYSYEIRHVENLAMATQMCASLSGMSGGMTIATEKLHTRSVTLPLEARIDLDSAKVTGMFYTFGHSLENDDPHKMLLYVWMQGGEKYYFGEGSERFNVTAQIHNAPNRRRVHIIIDSLELPRAIGGDDDWKVTVDDWDEVYEDIPMGSY